MTMEHAIQRITAQPADLFGLKGRGPAQGRQFPPTSRCSIPTRSARPTAGEELRSAGRRQAHGDAVARHPVHHRERRGRLCRRPRDRRDPRAGAARVTAREPSRRALLGAGLALLAARPHIARAQAPQPATVPRFEVPVDACDCHVHVIGDPKRFPMAAGAQLHAAAGLRRGAGRAADRVASDARPWSCSRASTAPDNRCTLDALRQLGPRARGVAVIGDTTTDRELDGLQKAGVRCVRINLETGGQSDPGAARQALWAAAARISGRDLAHPMLYPPVRWSKR